MTRPVGRIEVWEPEGETALYTIDDAVGIYFKEIITGGVGNFNFAVYSHKDFSGNYTYPNIDLGDWVKIWLDWDTIAGGPNFIGKVRNRSGPILTDTGWVRRIAGLSQGEILLRRFKKNKYYDAVDASVIVREWATDLGLESDPWKVEACTTDVTLEVRTKSYFDLLRWISDYWASGETQVKKDYWVDLDNELYWHDRPFRTVGVESLTTSDFLVDPLVERELETVKNDITVYGAAETFLPADKDEWTEPDADPPSEWTAVIGTMARESVAKKLGLYSVECQTAGNKTQFYRALPLITLRDITTLKFWRTYSGINATTYEVRLWAPDSSNYFKSTAIGGGGNWEFVSIPLGVRQEYDAVENPDGVWTKTGSPNWYNIQGIEFYTEHGNVAHVDIDALYFEPVRYEGSAEDSGEGSSQASYGICEAEFTDDKQHSDSDCDKRAETLLYQLKDPPTQITIQVKGNDNVLVGDRLTITIPSESISAQPYDVIAVENLLNMDNWTTTATMVNSVNWRLPFKTRSQVDMRRRIRELSMNEKGIS